MDKEGTVSLLVIQIDSDNSVKNKAAPGGSNRMIIKNEPRGHDAEEGTGTKDVASETERGRDARINPTKEDNNIGEEGEAGQGGKKTERSTTGN